MKFLLWGQIASASLIFTKYEDISIHDELPVKLSDRNLDILGCEMSLSEEGRLKIPACTKAMIILYREDQFLVASSTHDIEIEAYDRDLLYLIHSVRDDYDHIELMIEKRSVRTLLENWADSSEYNEEYKLARVEIGHASFRASCGNYLATQRQIRLALIGGLGFVISVVLAILLILILK